MNHMRKLLIAVCLEAVVFALAMWLHVVINYASWCQWESPALWDCTCALSDASLWIAVAQYMAVSTAFLLAWLVWNWPGHKLSYILLAWGITWLPMAWVATEDCARLPDGPIDLPLYLFASPFFAVFCVAEALLIGFFMKSPRKV